MKTQSLPVLVTGACGLVGSTIALRLEQSGFAVVATDVAAPTPGTELAALVAGGSIAFEQADLTDQLSVERLLQQTRPRAVVHLAAIIPPLCYRARGLARRVNVDATRLLVEAAGRLDAAPRFLMASSMAVYGARNPHLLPDPIAADALARPTDLYGALKFEAEELVAGSELDWSILRLTGVMTPMPRWDAGLDLVRMEGLLPTDGRIQTVDVRDVAVAFEHALEADCLGERLIIGGDDETHRVLQGFLGPTLASAMGLVNGLPEGRPGDPTDPDAWFATDWVDTAHSQSVLHYQRHTLDQLIAESGARAGWRAKAVRPFSPVVRRVGALASPYRGIPGPYAQPWQAIERLFGNPYPD